MTQQLSPARPVRRYPPGPKPLPIVGNALHMRGADALERHLALQREYGDIVYMRLGPLDAYVLTHPDHVYHVMVKNQKNYIKGVGYNSFRLLVGQGLVTSDGDLWRQQRRLMQPSFTPKAITQFADMMVELTQRLLDRWQPLAVRGEPFVMDEEMTRLTMSIIGRAMFNLDLGEELTEIGAAFQRAFSFVPQRSQNPFIPLNFPLPAHRQFQRDLELIERFIAQRIAEGRRNPTNDTLLGILLRAQDEETGQGMSDAQLRDEVVTLFFAGFETTARSLTWGWYLLSQHPAVVAKLEEEVDHVLGGRAPTIEDLHQLHYTRMVVDETLRLYPPTALLARQTVAEDEIGGYPLPAGAMVIPVPYAVHRHPDFWPDAERFDPERFLPEADAVRPKSAYIPFAAGPRVCLGNNFALLEMVYAFAMAAARYRVENLTGAIGKEFAGTIRPTQPLRVRLHPR